MARGGGEREGAIEGARRRTSREHATTRRAARCRHARDPARSRVGAARACPCHRLGGERPGSALAWSDFGRIEAPALRVTAAVRLYGDSSLSEWRIVVDSLGPMAIEQVRFPRLTGLRQLGSGEELAVPRSMGALARDPAMLLAGPDGKGRRLDRKR